MSKIEFIIPTYNRPDFLMCTINSIVAQRSDRWKIHVVADCPPAGTLDKIMKYFEGDFIFLTRLDISVRYVGGYFTTSGWFIDW